MARECAGCYLEFRGRRAWMMVWCPVDRRYFCQRCYRDICEPIHGDKPLLRKTYRMAGIGGLVVFGSGLVPFGLFLALGPPGAWTSPNPTLGGLAMLAFVSAGVTWLAASLATRGILQRRAMRGHPPLPTGAFVEAPSPGLSWRPNRAAYPRRLAVLVSIVAVAAALDAVCTVAVASTSSLVSTRFLEVVVVLASLIGGTAGLLAALPFPVPSAIAFGDDGIHFWYDSPIDRRCVRDVLPWVDLNLLAMRSPGNVDVARRLVRYLRLDSENANLLAEEWPKHRIDRSVGPSPGPTIRLPATAERTGPLRPSVPPVEGQVGASQRGAVCARCRVRFPGLEGLRLLWCKVDHFFVCRRCWRLGCKEGHGRGKKAVSNTPRLVVAAALGITFLVVWYPGFAYDEALTGAWHSENPVTIATLQAGELAKVVGVITSNQLIAWGGHEIYSSNGGWWWDWNATDSFDLSDFAGVSTIAVTTQAYYIGYAGPHLAPYAVHTQMWVYERGDRVQIVGTVILTGSGSLALEAQILSQIDAVPLITLAPSIEDIVLVAAIPVSIVGLAGAFAAILLTRRHRTRKALGGQPTLTLNGSNDSRDPNLDWKPNGRGTNPKRRGRLALAILVPLVSLLALYVALMPRPESGYWNLGFFGTLAVILGGFSGGMVLFGGIGKPSFVAVAEDGFWMWYDSPYDRHLNDAVFPWGEIRDIHMTTGKGAHWVLRWTAGEFTNLYMLKGSNLSLLLKEWAARRMPDS